MKTIENDIEMLDNLADLLFAKLDDINLLDVSGTEGRTRLKQHEAYVNACGKIITSKLVKTKMMETFSVNASYQLTE